ncbi:MAG: PD-(D/E)XK nuclease family protein [Oscillospiraceae bacterium]|jgi:ATP-dependent helicase/nuclease subunit B
MLRLILGPAGSGKTSYIMREIAVRAQQGGSGMVLIVPEQYSFEAERELCRLGGNRSALHAEVLSFSRLAARVAQETGTGGRVAVDAGGRLLCMALALDSIGGSLSVYGAARYRAEMLSGLLACVTEMKNAAVSPDELLAAAEGAEDSLKRKLKDVALCLEAYDAVLAQGRADPADRLTRLAETLGESSVGTGGVYFDGFTDFTGTERGVIKALFARGTDLTVCLTCGGLSDESEHFAVARAAALQLKALAEEAGQKVEVTELSDPPEKAPQLAFFDRQLFAYTEEKRDAQAAVRVFRCESIRAECEFAASECVRLARETGCRWREIAVAARGFEEYAAPLQECFRLYGVPLFTARRGSILQKPVPALLAAAFEILETNWDTDAVLAYLKTGLTGLTLRERDELEDYAVRWKLRGSIWTREAAWTQHPDGFGKPFDDAARERLTRLDALRRRLAAPLVHLALHGKEAKTASEQVQALTDYLVELGLPDTLEKKAAGLEADGRAQLAAEYGQLWSIVVSSLEQTAAVLGGMEMDQSCFSKLFLRMLSQYDVSAIPVSLDSVSAGDMDRMRRRHIRHLIVLGASDDRLPRVTSPAGVFTPDERDALDTLGVHIGGGSDGLDREYSTIYNCVTLPSDTLTLSYAAFDGSGAVLHPSFLVERAKKLFDLKETTFDLSTARLEAEAPAFLLAAAGDGSGPSRAAEAYFAARSESAERLSQIREQAERGRGALSPASVGALYGETPRLSPSRTDAFAACRFFYFLRYGLRLNEKETAGFEAPELGSFMHYVLEHTADEIRAGVGFQNAGTALSDALADKYTDLYIKEQLGGLADKSPRFCYLFDRLRPAVRRVTADMVKELAVSKFTPLDFELKFLTGGDLPPVRIPDGPVIDGIADRVDGWEHDGKLYLRVIDYKTGKKSFSFTDIRNGMGMQMLLYLFALENEGQARYGREIVPAGVLYVPARDALVSSPGDLTDEELAAKKQKALRRSGLISSDAEVIAAMEDVSDPQYIPVSFKRDGTMSSDSVASPEQFARLKEHVADCMRALGRELKSGSIEASPYYKSEQENACLFCPYQAVCRFDEGRDRRRYLKKVSPQEFWEELEGKDDGEI